MSRYRKKPVEIEARRWDGDADGLYGWLDGLLRPDESQPMGVNGDGTIGILTLEGVMTAQHGDWIICGIAGEFYPCKPDIFAATYEPVTGEKPAP